MVCTAMCEGRMGFLWMKGSFAKPETSINFSSVRPSHQQTLLFLQVDLITSVRHTTRHKTFTACPSPCQNEVAEVLDPLRPKSIRLGVRGDVLLEDEVLRVVEGVDGPVLGFDCEVSQHVFVSMMVCGIEDVVDAYLRGSCSGFRSSQS
jgi:hypothetical protein